MSQQKPDVQAAIEFLRQKLENTGQDNLQIALEIGRYLFENFFEGNIHSFVRGGNESREFMAVMNHEVMKDLRLTKRTLQNYIHVAVQHDAGRIPPEAQSLGLAHRIKLLRAKGPHLPRLAIKATKERWSARKLGAEVQKATDPTKAKKKPARRHSRQAAVIVEVAHAVGGLVREGLQGLDEEDLSWIGGVALQTAGRLEDLAEAVRIEWDSKPRSEPFEKRDDWDNGVACSVEEFDAFCAEVLENWTPSPPREPRNILRSLAKLGTRVRHELREGHDDREVQAWAAAFAVSIHGMFQPVVPAKKNGKRPAEVWWVIQTYTERARAPERDDENFGEMILRMMDDPRTARCLVEATDEPVAVQEFLAAAGDIGALKVEAIRLKAWLASLKGKPSIPEYLQRPREKRLPNLSEMTAEGTWSGQ